MKIKQEQQKKRKRSSAQRSLSNSNTLTFITQTPTQYETNASSSSTSVTPSISDASSTWSRFTPVQNKINEIDHIRDIEERINKWWSTTNDDNLSLVEGTH